MNRVRAWLLSVKQWLANPEIEFDLFALMLLPYWQEIKIIGFSTTALFGVMHNISRGRKTKDGVKSNHFLYIDVFWITVFSTQWTSCREK